MVLHLLTLNQKWKQGFPGHPVLKTRCFRCKGCQFDPWSGELRSYKSPGTAKNKQNNNKNWKQSAKKDTEHSSHGSPLQRTSVARRHLANTWGYAGRVGGWGPTELWLNTMAPQARAQKHVCVHMRRRVQGVAPRSTKDAHPCSTY